jgi:two-component system, LytTR family, sensor kinase
LFNTLNAISTLVIEERTGDAEAMIARLGHFLRLTLEGTEADEIPLTEELEFVRRYLEIETVRFADRLSVDIDAEPAVLGARVPAMILQPIVENALRHADGHVTIAARRRNGVLQLSVTDNGSGRMDAAKGHGIGLANTRERLRHLYGDAQRLELQPATGGGVRATIELPFATP